MDLQTLRFFVTTADEGSFTAAGDKLLYAQSNLSSRIRQLENELGEPLFYRYKKGVSLTAKGRIFYDYASRVLSLTEEAVNAVQDMNHAKGELHLGSLEATALKNLPELLAAYHSDYPDVRLSLQTDMNDDLVQFTLDRKIDGAFVAGPCHHPDLIEAPYDKDELMIVGSSRLPVIPVDTLLETSPLITFPEGAVFRRRLELLLSSRSLVYTDRLNTMNSLSANISNICAGLGIGYLPRSLTRKYITDGLMKEFPLDNDPFSSLEVVFIYRKDRLMDAAFRLFLETIKKA